MVPLLSRLFIALFPYLAMGLLALAFTESDFLLLFAPAGVFALLVPMGESCEKQMLPLWIAGMFVYLALSVSILCCRRKQIVIRLVFVLLGVMLMNVGGCVRMLKHIHL